MRAAVPTASAVITNPTHYAVALKDEHGQSNAPKVVAKGVDAVAARIREVARANGVAMIATPPLARTLHAAVEIGREVPPDHYAAVAEVIGYVLRSGEHTLELQSLMRISYAVFCLTKNNVYLSN